VRDARLSSTTSNLSEPGSGELENDLMEFRERGHLDPELPDLIYTSIDESFPLAKGKCLASRSNSWDAMIL